MHCKVDTKKSYLVRWVRVSEGHTISWSLQPQKKSINFGVFKHPVVNGAPPSLPTTPALEQQISDPSSTLDGPSRDRSNTRLTRRRSSATASMEASTAREKLERLGMKQVYWAGKCESDQATMGRYDVPAGEGGMYGCLLYTSPSPRDGLLSRMPSSA